MERKLYLQPLPSTKESCSYIQNTLSQRIHQKQQEVMVLQEEWSPKWSDLFSHALRGLK